MTPPKVEKSVYPSPSHLPVYPRPSHLEANNVADNTLNFFFSQLKILQRWMTDRGNARQLQGLSDRIQVCKTYIAPETILHRRQYNFISAQNICQKICQNFLGLGLMRRYIYIKMPSPAYLDLILCSIFLLFSSPTRLALRFLINNSVFPRSCWRG